VGKIRIDRLSRNFLDWFFPIGGFHSHKNSPELFGRDILRGIIIFKKGRSGMLEKTISTRH
jgi:hypothetical protein